VSIALGDVNGDGLLDLVIGNAGQPNFLLDVVDGEDGQPNQLLINSGDGTFSDSAAVSLPGGSQSTFSIALGDVNGDGLLDAVVGNADGQPNQLLINSGDGTFSDNTVLVTLPGGNQYTLLIALADVNGDGLLDAVVGNAGQPNQLIINSSDGTFSESTAVSLPGGSLDTRSIALGDVNGDGLLDAMVGNAAGQPNQLIINSSDGTFSNSTAVTLPGGSLELYTVSIALGDINGDGLLDAVVGNLVQPNQLLINSGDGTFSNSTAVSLPGGSRDTVSIALGDINGDGLLDAVIGNAEQPNQLIINSGDGTFSNSTTVSLPGGSQITVSIALGDIDGDGLLDAVAGNYNTPNQLLINSGDGTFSDSTTVTLPGGSQNTVSIALGDVNGDGLIDVVIGNNFEENQVLYYSVCRSGGARLHANSWCFNCPSFMGQALNSPFCQECIPDFVSGSGERCDLPCILGERKLGQDMCMKCADGTFYDNSFQRSIENPESWDLDRCVDCLNGTYANDEIAAVNQCFSCNPGFYQPNQAASQCIKCEDGSYQPSFGQASCISCAMGGYCDNDNSVNGGYTPCDAGTYNSLEGQYDESSCIACSAGTYTDKAGMVQCLNCPAGKFSSTTGKNKMTISRSFIICNCLVVLKFVPLRTTLSINFINQFSICTQTQHPYGTIINRCYIM
jgi:hypothetical protein